MTNNIKSQIMVLLLLLAGVCAYAQPAGWNINPAVF
ncbi:MAG: hypothetical protein RL013_2634, partial [Bacteroidota bacterium]